MGQDQSRAKNAQAAVTGEQGTFVAGSQDSAVATVPLAGIEGFQVVRLLPYSPAHKAGLVPYFDIITSLDHVLLETEGKPALQFFKSYIASHRDQPVCFTVFNLHIRAYRDVYCVPSDAWGGGGLLGCSIEWSRAESCPERCVHVVDVLEGSPAAYSGELKANRDYIIGMQTAQEPLISLIKNQKDFYSRLEGWHEEQRWTLERKQRFPSEAVDVPHMLLFLVYNSENNTVKEVAVEMGTNPDAALGMSVATGLLHIIPSTATAGDAAAASSLPVMNAFVRLEANRAIRSTPEMPAPATLSTPPPFHVQQLEQQQQDVAAHRHQQQLQQQEEQKQQVPPGAVVQPQHPAETDNKEEYHRVVNEEGVTHVTPNASAHETVSASLQSPQSNELGDDPAAVSTAPPDVHAANPPTPLPPQPFYEQQHQQQPEQLPYPMPPSLHENFIPPPRDDQHAGTREPSSGSSAAPAPAAAVHPPPPPHAAPLPKKSPLRSALASLEAYEHPPNGVAASLQVQEPHTASRAQPAAAPSPHQVLQAPQEQRQPLPHSAAEMAVPVLPPHTAVPSVTSSTPAAVADEASAASLVQQALPPLAPVPQERLASQSSLFSTSNMPPPLRFPVFPAAAARKRQQS
jgi:hypothetical protein